MVRSWNSFDGFSERSLRGRLKIGNFDVPTDIDWRVPQSKPTVFRLRKFNPAAHREMRRATAAGSIKTMGVTVRFDYIPGRAYLGIMKAAYLAMFKEFGYRYVLGPGTAIRELLRSYSSLSSDLEFLVAQIGDVTPHPREPWHFYVHPESEAVVMVILTVNADSKRHYLTFMPAPCARQGEGLNALLVAARKTLGR
jgi:hypothetical protein